MSKTRSRLRAGEFGRGDGAARTRCSHATQEGVSTTALWTEFVRRYERLITSCVLKVLRRYGAIFSRDDLDDLVGDVWLMLLRDDMKKLRQYDAHARLPHRQLPRPGRHQHHHRSPARASGRGHAARRRDRGLRVAGAPSAPRDAVEAREAGGAGARARWRSCRATSAPSSSTASTTSVSPEELARTLGVTTNTVYSRKFKIREKLQKIVRSLDGAPVAA